MKRRYLRPRKLPFFSHRVCAVAAGILNTSETNTVMLIQTKILLMLFVLLTTDLFGFQAAQEPDSEKPNVRDVLSKYVEAVGGEEQIENSLKTFAVKGTSTPIEDDEATKMPPGYARARWPKVSFKVQVKGDSLVYHAANEWESSGRFQQVAVGVHEDRMWRLMPNKVTLENAQAEVILRMLERYGHPKSAVLLKRSSANAEIIRQDQEKGDLIGIRFTDGKGRQTDRFFHKETGLLVKRVWNQKQGQNSAARYEETYEFHEQGAFKALKRVSRKIDGRLHTQIEFEDAILNREISDSVFEIPDTVWRKNAMSNSGDRG